jgi:hypothetical protein
MQVVIAQNPATVRAHATLDQVDASMALVAVGGHLGASEELDLCHRTT